MSKVLTLRGRKEGVVICVTEGYSFDDFIDSFKELIGTENSFFTGGKIVGIEGIKLSDEEKERFIQFIDGVEGIDFMSFDYLPKSKVKEEERENEDKKKPSFHFSNRSLNSQVMEEVLLEDGDFMANSLFFRGTVRSGVRLESEENILVVGDVNPGAELIAKSNIVVLGKLMGFAHAGSAGDEDKIIAAWKLQPTQLRIADYITMPPEGELEDIDYPEMALIEDGRVIIKSYQ